MNHLLKCMFFILITVFNVAFANQIPEYLQFSPKPSKIPLLEIQNLTKETLFADITNAGHAYKKNEIKANAIFHLPSGLEFDPLSTTTISIYNEGTEKGKYLAEWEIVGRGKTIYVAIIIKKRIYELMPQKGKHGKTEMSKLSLENNVTKEDITKIKQLSLK